MYSFYLACGSVRGQYLQSPLYPTIPFLVASWHTFSFDFFPPSWFHCIAAQCVPSPPASPTSLVPPPSADYTDSSHIMKVWSSSSCSCKIWRRALLSVQQIKKRWKNPIKHQEHLFRLCQTLYFFHLLDTIPRREIFQDVWTSAESAGYVST